MVNGVVGQQLPSVVSICLELTTILLVSHNTVPQYCPITGAGRNVQTCCSDEWEQKEASLCKYQHLLLPQTKDQHTERFP